MKTFIIILLLSKCTHYCLAADGSNPEVITETKQKHFLPTLLSVEDHVTGESLNALHNSLYDELKESTFVRDNRSLRGNKSVVHSTSLLQRHREPVPILRVNKQSVTFNSKLILSWKEDSVDDDDVISLHCPADDDDDRNFKDVATIVQARNLGIRSMNDSRDSNSALVSHWELRFPVIREDSCEFRLWSRYQNELHLISKTEKIKLPFGKTSPTAIHLSLTSSPDTINIHFTTGHFSHTSSNTKILVPVVEYISSTTGEWIKAEGTSDTYAASDMCEAPANITEAGKFINPGLLHTVQISNLEYDTQYFYRVGVVSYSIRKNHNIVWSQIHMFKSPSPPPEKLPADYKIKFLAYGDQGVPGGWCCNSSANITDMVANEVMLNGIRAIHHIGDLSYARGAAHLWDSWFEMIQPFATKVPLMVGIGNHEYDHLTGGDNGKDPSGEQSSGGFHPSWGNMNSSDSGGECGVPVQKRFLMPSGSEGSNGVFWYSYDMAMIHVIMISSEHDLSKGSRQYEWLERDLRRVNRTLTPWVILESHRPMYNSNNQTKQRIVGEHMREEFEDLLYENNVNVFLAGHFHSYLRTCPGLYKSICNNGGALHITVGTAGFLADKQDLYPQNWTEVYLRKNGYGRIEANKTNFLFEFIGKDEKSVLDSFMLIKGLSM